MSGAERLLCTKNTVKVWLFLSQSVFLNASYNLVFVNHKNSPQQAIQAHFEIVECVGAAGMVGGQSVDLALAKAVYSNDYLDEITNLKLSGI
jgi:hypothetical protein